MIEIDWCDKAEKLWQQEFDKQFKEKYGDLDE